MPEQKQWGALDGLFLVLLPVCCVLPLLVIAGASIGAAAFIGGVAVAAVVAVVAAIVVGVRARRRRVGACELPPAASVKGASSAGPAATRSRPPSHQRPGVESSSSNMKEAVDEHA